MEKQSIYAYIRFGTGFRYLQDVTAGYVKSTNEKGVDDGFVAYNIQTLLNDLDRFGLFVTRDVAIGKLERMLKEFKASAQGSMLTEEEAETLRKAMNSVRTVLDAEAFRKYAYVTTEKRIDIGKLLDNVGALFARDVFENLPEISRYDFIEAGKCIAFERPTAAAFHILRGTEGVLKQYYCCKVKKGRSQFLWGPMVESLRKKKRLHIPAALLNNLDNIRENFRNPTAHPEATYDISEVQDLLSLCADVVNRMVKHL